MYGCVKTHTTNKHKIKASNQENSTESTMNGQFSRASMSLEMHVLRQTSNLQGMLLHMQPSIGMARSMRFPDEMWDAKETGQEERPGI